MINQYERFRAGQVRFFVEGTNLFEVKIRERVEVGDDTIFSLEVLAVTTGDKNMVGTVFEVIHVHGKEPGWKITQSLVGATGEVGALSF